MMAETLHWRKGGRADGQFNTYDPVAQHRPRGQYKPRRWPARSAVSPELPPAAAPRLILSLVHHKYIHA